MVLNDQQIIEYIEQNNLDAQKSSTGLYYVIDEPGTGIQPNSNSNVTVAYKGYFLNGTVFDQSDSQGISFGLQQVIKGWTEGITYFNEGGNGMLLVPANLGYGNDTYRGIPGGSVLIVDVLWFLAQNKWVKKAFSKGIKFSFKNNERRATFKIHKELYNIN